MATSQDPDPHEHDAAALAFPVLAALLQKNAAARARRLAVRPVGGKSRTPAKGGRQP